MVDRKLFNAVLKFSNFTFLLEGNENESNSIPFHHQVVSKMWYQPRIAQYDGRLSTGNCVRGRQFRANGVFWLFQDHLRIMASIKPWLRFGFRIIIVGRSRAWKVCCVLKVKVNLRHNTPMLISATKSSSAHFWTAKARLFATARFGRLLASIGANNACNFRYAVYVNLHFN